MIVAIGSDGAIGKDGSLIWSLPGDLKRFKALTTGKSVVMGRKTWESLPKRPLPGRKNIVMTRRRDWDDPGAIRASSVEEALEKVESGEVFIIGGAEIYKTFLPMAEKLYLTEVEAETPEADARLQIDLTNCWKKQDSGEFLTNQEGVRYRYVNYIRE